jgi:cation diffusion facilitator CzcD-associated flavoprotein CzcO
MAQTNKSSATTPDHEVLIIGTGFAGLCMAIQLKKAGLNDFVMLEKEADLGGTWYVNTYPGCACDVPSHMYSFSFEPNPNWSREFASQPEILTYIRHCADKYALRPRVRFNSQAVGARFDEVANLWRVRIADAGAVGAFMAARGLKPGDTLPTDDAAFPATRELTARFVVAGMGGLSTPAYPQLKGLEKFEGRTFHSQRWDHSYDLTGKRVAVIGTGASAIQIVPAIQPKVGHLDLYQRTAPWVLPKPNPEISQRRKALYRYLPVTRAAERLRLYTLLESRAIAFTLRPELTKEAERFGRAYLKRRVADPELRKKLTPDYAMGCKRVLLSSEWYPALTQPNVDVVTNGITEVRAHSIVDSAGVEREVDAIIYGTGFRLTDLVPRGTIYGRAGQDLVDAWPHGPEAYKGTTVANFPNMFILVGPNTGLGHNSIIYMIEAQVSYVIDALRLMHEKEYATLEVRADEQARFNDALQKKSKGTVWEKGGCRSYYLHPESGRNVAVWPDFTFRFAWTMRKFDASAYKLARARSQGEAAE